jgi:hypothetical protein
MPFLTKYCKIDFVEALSIALTRFGYFDEWSIRHARYFYDDVKKVLKRIVIEQDKKLFDVMQAVMDDIDEIALVKFACDPTSIFWRGGHLFEEDKESRWLKELRLVEQSQYATPSCKEPVRGIIKTILEERKSFVYLVSCKEGYFKIGRSQDPGGRLLSFSTLPPFEFELEHTIETDTDNDRMAEAKLHKIFSDKRAQGEWFRLEEEDVKFFKSITKYENGEFITNSPHDGDGRGRRDPLVEEAARKIQSLGL